MEFTVEDKDYNVADFYDSFVKSLPKIAMVNQGFYGEISTDTFDRGQIIRLHTVSQQSRVIAKTLIHGRDKFYSIPLSYHSNFCVVKHGKAGKELPLTQLIRDYTRPCEVQFPKHKSIEVGNHTIHTDQLPMLELTRVFSEIYLLGNFIVDGVLAHGVVHVPLYLSQMRLAIVTGIKGQPSYKWKSYQEELNRSTVTFEFDKEFGNPDIAEYNPERIEKIAVDSDLEYAKAEPSIYTNFPALFRAGVVPRSNIPKVTTREETTDDVYETISHPEDNTSQVTMTSFKTNLESKLTKKAQQKKPPPTAPKPTTDTPEHTASHTRRKTGAPPLPARNENASPWINRKHIGSTENLYINTADPLPKVNKKQQPNTQENQYMNKVGQVSPLVKSVVKPSLNPGTRNEPAKQKESNPQTSQQKESNPQTSQQKESKPQTSQQKESNPQTSQQKESKPQTETSVQKPPLNPTDIAKLSVEDVGTYLQALNLDKYINAFRENLIDGTILKELDRDLMKTDFKMSGIEALRLMKFISEGHIPT